MRSFARAHAVPLWACLLSGCDGTRSPVAPSLPDASLPVPSTRTGPVEIAFVGAEPRPGTTITGCGIRVSGCEGRVIMRFSLRAPRSGSVLGMRVFLHATNLVACLSADTGPFVLAQGEQQVTVVFDESDDCPVPLSIQNLAAVVEGTSEVASRQTWSLSYTFAP